MTHEDVLKLALSVHTAVLMAAVAAFYRYGERSSFARNGADKARGIKQQLRYRIAEELRERLRPVFEDVEVIEISPILDDHGDPWAETLVNPAGGENYRNALSDFITNESDGIADYRTMQITLSRWEVATCVRSWLVLATVFWQLFVLTVLGVFEKLLGLKIRDSLIEASFLPMAFGLTGFFISSAIIMYTHDRILHISRRYE